MRRISAIWIFGLRGSSKWGGSWRRRLLGARREACAKLLCSSIWLWSLRSPALSFVEQPVLT